MTDSFVTQCPHCQTSFRVTHHQLSVARGVVRCGHCLQVFNAAKQLLEQTRAASDEPAAPPAAPEPVASPPPAAQPLVEPLTPAEDSWAVTAGELDALDLDQELARLERRSPGDRRKTDAKAALHARRDDAAGDEPADELFGTATDERPVPELEPEAAPVLVEQQPLELEPLADERTEPTLGSADLDLDDEPTGHPQPLAVHVDAPLEQFSSRDEPVPEQGLSALDDEVRSERLSARDDDEPDEHVEPRLEPALALKPERSRKEPLVDVVDDPLQLGWEKPAPNWGKRLLWGLLTLLAAGLLAFQYVWYHFDEMARQDQYRPWFQQVCPMIGCEVPTRVDISRIKSSNLVVRSHPDFKGALIVDAIIYNRAPFAQPFPLLELRFADLNGQLIASRRFKPSEYLSGELAGRGEMPSQTPIHIALDILDPGPKAVNYSLSFRSPE
ncbi:DUF3426 domain-containing protein [Pseudomonas sp. UFMG81]|uniref:DUF3426 domain-containing protein n=1 Tax=Pseudomonas sp. UFMG81 TaxID=2745936 RepID=UPI00188FBBC7|nr:DUF3426 domain-containing protein [Pseudomonas sp. UFMG81]